MTLPSKPKTRLDDRRDTRWVMLEGTSVAILCGPIRKESPLLGLAEELGEDAGGIRL
jgi:hypothetical protein